MSETDVAEFTSGALFTWVESCLPAHESLADYDALLDGTILHKIWLQIDPEPQHHIQPLDAVEALYLCNARAKNFDCIIKNLKILFEEELDQTVLVLPDCAILGHSPKSRSGLEQMQLLMTLLLGAAVQCPNKQIFIARIKELDLDSQHAIVELIKQVTDSQTLVLTNDSLEHLSPERMYEHIIRIARERDKFQSNWIASLANDAGVGGCDVGGGKQLMSSSTSASANASAVAAAAAAATVAMSAGSGAGHLYGGGATPTDSNHMAVELADLKSKLRRFRQELEEKSEAYLEVKEELDHTHSQMEKLRTESQKWYAESRKAAAYRDEVDVLQERAERANRLELEVQKYRERLSDSEFFKTRVDELREDNRMLSETKEMLEEQLQRSRKRSDHAMQLETDIMKYKQRLNDMALERDADKARLHELLEENTQLMLAANQCTNAASLSAELAVSDEECASEDNSLSEQLTNNAQTRALKLELENRRLQQSLDAAKEANFHEHAVKLLEAEKDKKRLSLKVEQLQENCGRLSTQNTELEVVFKNLLEENRKLQDAIDQQRASFERQQSDRDVDRMKLIDTEKHVESLTKDKERIQTLSDSIQRRADDLERTLKSSEQNAAQLQPRADRCEAVEQELHDSHARVHTLEKENAAHARELSKLRETLEQKDVALDRHSAELAGHVKEVKQLQRKLETFDASAGRLLELETRNYELNTQATTSHQTIAALRKDLVDATLATDRVRSDLEKLGIDSGDLDAVELNVESVVKNLVRDPETFRTVKAIVLNYSSDGGTPLTHLTTATSSSDMAVMCHRHEIFTVEKQIEINSRNADDALLHVMSNDRSNVMPTVANTTDTDVENQLANTSIGSTASSDLLKRVEFNVSLESPALGMMRDQLVQMQHDTVALRTVHDALQAENARYKVDTAALTAQVQSLQMQHAAMLLANTQLAAEKDALVGDTATVRSECESLLHDQLSLRCLHEQLSAEYETLSVDRELLKNTIRDQRLDVRHLKERDAQLTAQADELQRQQAAMRKENENLGNLRAEHSKLKDDFRNLFTTSERLKCEYKNMQAQYKLLRAENGALRLQEAKLMDEVNTRTEMAAGVELEYTKCTQRCEMLLQMNANLDTDRRTLMEHVSQLLSQYHELLAHSLDDKQHYHDEEKLFTDKVNNLHRQKEKLEEKIMEHYKKLESCSPKKKPFGSSFVKRVKKASTDLINKVPSRNRRSWLLEDARNIQSEHALGSDSGGNESDNSISDPMASMSLSTISGGVQPDADDMSDTHLPPMLQRNAYHRQSLQRRPHETPTPPTLLLRHGGVRSSYQSLRRDDSMRSHRNSLHSMEPPDVTGSSLTLGTAGSRRTVYLLDENAAASKLPSDSNRSAKMPSESNSAAASSSSTKTTSSTTASTSHFTATVHLGPDSNAGGGSGGSTGGLRADTAQQPPPPTTTPPSTFLMFNRISNIIGGTGGNATTASDRSPAKEPKPSSSPPTPQPTSTVAADEGKESAIWYEYGCI